MFVSEFFATFVFVLSILVITSISGLSQFQTALGVGLALTASILICFGLDGNSKAHLNPAVSLMSVTNGDTKVPSFFVLILLQFVAALLALGVFKLFRLERTKEFFKQIDTKIEQKTSEYSTIL